MTHQPTQYEEAKLPVRNLIFRVVAPYEAAGSFRCFVILGTGFVYPIVEPASFRLLCWAKSPWHGL